MDTLKLESDKLGAPLEIELDRGLSYTLGRKGCDILIDFEPFASRKHARLSFRGKAWELVDLESANGVKVDDHLVACADLGEGVSATIGTTRLSIAMSHDVEALAPSEQTVEKNTSLPSQPKTSRRSVTVESEASSSNSVWHVVIGVMVLTLGLFAFVRISSATEESEAEQPVVEKPSPESQAKTHPLQAMLDEIRAIEPIEERGLRLVEFQSTYWRDIRGTALEGPVAKQILDAEAAVDADTAEVYRLAMLKVDDLRARNRYRDAQRFLTELKAEIEGHNRYWRGRPAAVQLEQRIEILLRETLPVECATYVDIMLMRAQSLSRIKEFEQAYAEIENVEGRMLENRAFALRVADASREIDKAKEVYLRTKGGASTVVETSTGLADITAKFRPPVELNLPEANPLLPRGRASEEELIAALYARVLDHREAVLSGSKVVVVDGIECKLRDVGGDGISVFVQGRLRNISWPEVATSSLEELIAGADLNGFETSLGLALLAFERDEIEFATRMLVDVYEHDNESKSAIDMLIAAKRRMPTPEGGFVLFDGRFMAPIERDQAKLEMEIAGHVQTLLVSIDRPIARVDYSTADQAFDELLSLGDLATETLVEALEQRRIEVREKTETATGLLGDTKELKKLKRELLKRRERALKLINSEREWPYPYGDDNEAVTERVVALIDAVREIWEDPHALAGESNADFDAHLELLVWVNTRMDQIDPRYRFHTKTSSTDLEYVRALANQSLDIKSFALNASDKNTIVRNKTIMQENAEKREEFNGLESAPKDEAWEQLRITNEYRIMMGRGALRMNFKLGWAAYYHSKYCVQKYGNGIAHYIEGEPRGVGPMDRALYEGYSSSVGENIHLHSLGPTAQSSHRAWVESSGHSRNLLVPQWTVMGNGRFGNVWTQLFGSLDEGDANTESRGGK